MNEFYPNKVAGERLTIRSNQMLLLGIVALISDGIIIHDSYVERQKEAARLTPPECVEFTSRDDFFDMSHAEGCTDEMQDGRVALIDLRGPEAIPSASELAVLLTSEMTRDTYGIMTSKVEAVPASSDVIDAVQDDECDPYEDSVIKNLAYSQGEQLRSEGYDKAVVLTPVPLCDETVLGYAESTKDIAVVGRANSMREDELIRVAQHELAHLYGIGHSSVLRGGELNDLVLYEYMYEDPRFDTSIDIASIVKNAQPDEYGDSASSSTQYQGAFGAIMGTPTPNNQLEDAFSNYQLQLLEASQRLPTETNADLAPVTLEPGVLRDGDPIVATVGGIEIEGFEKYDRVIVSPRMLSGMRWNAAEVALGSAGGDSLVLGQVYLKDVGEEGQLVPLNQQYTLVGSEAAARISFDDGAITIERLGL